MNLLHSYQIAAKVFWETSLITKGAKYVQIKYIHAQTQTPLKLILIFKIQRYGRKLTHFMVWVVYNLKLFYKKELPQQCLELYGARLYLAFEMKKNFLL